ncbi:MAG: DNA recombination protein RmuC [Candidatus Acidiferrales bacterium]|jgi:DNA recombination protein RmuC
MSPIVWLILGLVAIGVVAAIVWSAARRSDAQLSAVRQEMQNSLATQGQSVNAQINHLMQSVTTQLGQVRQELQTGVASSGKLASDAQIAMAQQLQSSNETIRKISMQIAEVQQAGQQMSQSAQTLQNVLGGAKTRGVLGEVVLERLLQDALPRGAYETQYRFDSTGAIVDAIVRSGDRILSVDSKFPLDAYRRLFDSGESARREFSLAVRKHADAIAEKYILPDEHTFDYALMFVPSEGVYYELLMTEDSKYGQIDEYCRAKRVFPVSPNTFYACLSAVAISLQGQKIEENARHLLAGMGGLKKQFEAFAEVYDRLGTHLRHAQQSYEDADSRLSRARNSLEQMAQGALPALETEAPTKALSAAVEK